ncbi:hypothetical protein WKI71_19560 [Streptomyces sp. MS1.AVA.1]|uniref:Lipoprotein n=1 Tax=Streptomyces machairae TaxID=3134109 RepID=A0ABU8ULN0_9ACTN
MQLSASQAGDLNPVVVDGAGFTLYRFDKDTANPSRSNCSGECATTWPPVLVAPAARSSSTVWTSPTWASSSATTATSR